MIQAHIRIQVSRLGRGHCGANRPVTMLSRLLFAAALGVFPALASAEIVWHRDLPAARAASAASGKPVFALFVATWDEKPNPEVFANAEVEAVISACFEPVRVDVDARPDVVKSLAIDRIPSVAVLDSNGGAISRFDCPKTPAEFVAAAARAAQVTASTSTPRNGTEQASAAGGTAFGGGFESSPPIDDTSVADKVRQLSSFAEGKAMPPRDASRFSAVAATAAPAIPAQPSPVAAPAYAGYQAPSVAPYSPPAAAPTADPSLARTPPAWPAERPAASAYSRFQPAAPQAPAAAPAVIEPAPSINSAPWIAGAPAPAGQLADAEPEATATASDEGTVAKPKPNAFLAALQKPMSAFSSWTSKPTIEPPPKMPPARPQLPSALAAAPIVPPAAGAAPATATDPGPMPLGLEGYCPVTIAERGAWVEGRAQWGVRHRGRTYLFAGPEQQQTFLANPDQFAPALAGDDPVLAFESGRSEAGQRAFGVTYGSRMYLFSSPETRAAFTADPNRYTTRVQIAEGLAPSDAARRF